MLVGLQYFELKHALMSLSLIGSHSISVLTDCLFIINATPYDMYHIVLIYEGITLTSFVLCIHSTRASPSTFTYTCMVCPVCNFPFI